MLSNARPARSTKMIRILIADDHPIIRNGLKQILAEEPDMAVEGEAGNAAETLALVRERTWEVLVLDMSMPGQDGFGILQEVKQLRPELPVLFLSMHPEEQFAIRVLKAGAAGYLAKASAPEELVKAIRKVH